MKRTILSIFLAITAFHVFAVSPIQINESTTKYGPEKGSLIIIGGGLIPADSYLNTLTHQAFWDVLNRGGVIAGTSAGASIQGSFLWRGDTSGAQITVGDHTQGLGFLKNSVIDQHILRRNRQFDLINVIKESPKLIGIGLDESTAIVVQRDTFEVIGQSYIAVYDYKTIVGSGEKHVVGNNENYSASTGPFFFLSKGQKYDLNNRLVIHEPRKSKEIKDNKRIAIN